MQETEADHSLPSEVISGLLLGISGSFFDCEDNYFFLFRNQDSKLCLTLFGVCGLVFSFFF